MNKLFCDVCDKEMKKGDSRAATIMFVEVKSKMTSNQIEPQVVQTQNDLCDKCSLMVSDFLKAEKEKASKKEAPSK